MANSANSTDDNFVDRDPEELFCLRWNDYQDNVMATLSDLRQEEDFFDVTLAIEGRQLRAHKLILSACSVFFRRLLRANPAPNPVIVLWDVTFDDMVNLLDFMYNGEVRVRHASIQNFLGVAEKFRVRGLCQNDSANSVPTSRSGTPQPKSPESQKSRKRARRESGRSALNEPEVSINDPVSPAGGKQRQEDVPPVSTPSTSNQATNVKAETDSITNNDSSNPETKTTFDDIDPAAAACAAASLNTGSILGMAAAAGMSPSIMDQNAAKEFWRRAAALGLNPLASMNSSPLGPSPGGPSAVSNMINNNHDGTGLRRPRSVYTSHQINQLEHYFSVNEYIDGERKRQLSQITNIPEHQIKVWFKNRRQKKKRECEAAEEMNNFTPSASSMFPHVQSTPPSTANWAVDPDELSS